MPKPAHRTISYVVYPKDYKPGDGYQEAKSLLNALRICRKYGAGSEIQRQFKNSNKRHSISGWIHRDLFIYKG